MGSNPYGYEIQFFSDQFFAALNFGSEIFGSKITQPGHNHVFDEYLYNRANSGCFYHYPMEIIGNHASSFANAIKSPARE